MLINRGGLLGHAQLGHEAGQTFGDGGAGPETEQAAGFLDVRPGLGHIPGRKGLVVDDGLFAQGLSQEADQFAEFHRLGVPQVEDFVGGGVVVDGGADAGDDVLDVGIVPPGRPGRGGRRSSTFRRLWVELGLEATFRRLREGTAIETDFDEAVAWLLNRLCDPMSKLVLSEWIATVYRPEWEKLGAEYGFSKDKRSDRVLDHERRAYVPGWLPHRPRGLSREPCRGKDLPRDPAAGAGAFQVQAGHPGGGSW